jgi:hypothetical protein
LLSMLPWTLSDALTASGCVGTQGAVLDWWASGDAAVKNLTPTGCHTGGTSAGCVAVTSKGAAEVAGGHCVAGGGRGTVPAAAVGQGSRHAVGLPVRRAVSSSCYGDEAAWPWGGITGVQKGTLCSNLWDGQGWYRHTCELCVAACMGLETLT